MLDHLPDLIDPYEFVEKNRRIKGKMPFVGMDRLRDAILNLDDVANIDIEFKREGRIAAIVGRLEANLALRCQCCLEVLKWPVASDIRLGVVRSIDEANALPAEFEPLLVESDSAIALADIVQDEVLLAMPDIPQHEECHLPKPAVVSEPREHPFAALARLKKTNH